MQCEPVQQHKWLQKFLGEWTYEGSCGAMPDQPPMKYTGTEVVRAIGDLWIVGESRGEMPGGGEAKMILTVGFDPEKGRFVGSWIGSMMTHLWTYEGELDASQRVLTLNTEGKMPGATGMSKFQDITEFKSDNERIFTARMLNGNGEWQQLMSTTYRRK